MFVNTKELTVAAKDNAMDRSAARPIFPFLWMRGESEDVLRREIRKISECGIKGICVESRPHPDFLGEGWWHDMDIVMEEAEAHDMLVWILDDAHFPTGYAGGAVKDNPDLSKLYLSCAYSDAVGPAPAASLDCRAMMERDFTWKDLFMKPRQALKDEKNLISVTARRFAGGNEVSNDYIELSDKVDENGILHFDLPDGQWRILVLFTTRDGGGDPEYINPLESESVQLLLDKVYEPHWTRYGNKLAGFFSDEPCYGNVEGYDHDNAVGRKRMNLPWCSALPKRMEECLGKDWAALLPLLWLTSKDARLSASVRLHYMEETTAIHAVTFSGQIGAWCAERNLEYIGHVVEDNGSHSRLGCGCGHYFRAIAGQHMAGIDIIGSQMTRGGGEQLRYGFGQADNCFFHHALPAMGASAAMLDPKKQGRLMCELFGAYGWTFGVRDMKWLTDFLICRGVNRLVPHAFSMKEYPDPDCPPHFYANGKNEQYRHFGQLMRYADVLCKMFSGGVGGARTAILYPAQSDWMNQAMSIEMLGKILDEHQVDFWVLPEEALEEGGLPENVSVDMLVIPHTCFLSARAARLIAKRTPESVVFVKDLPEYIPDADKSEEAELLRTLSKCAVVKLKHLGSLCAERGLAAGRLEPKCGFVHIYRYFKDGKWLCMVFNESADKTFSGTAELPSCGKVALSLKPYDSAVFDDGVLVVSPAPAALSGAKEMNLSANWSLSLAEPSESFGAAVPVQALKPVSESHPYFSGRMRYSRELILEEKPKTAILDIQWVFETADVFVNGELAATRLTPPYRFDISNALRKGKNTICVEVTAPPARDVLKYNLGPFGPERSVIEPTGMFGCVKLETIGEEE